MSIVDEKKLKEKLNKLTEKWWLMGYSPVYIAQLLTEEALDRLQTTNTWLGKKSDVLPKK